MNRTRRIGVWGEQKAAEYLIARGYEIIGQNLRTPYGEIDLLARKEDQTVFVEVKSRTSGTFGPPEIGVSRRKQTHMISCAQHYAQQNRIDHWRIDVIAVERTESEPRITHFENAVSDLHAQHDAGRSFT